MKKSRSVQLVLITAALAGCADKQKNNEWTEGNKTYIRSDSTAPYYRPHGHIPGLWFYAFRPFGSFGYNGFHRAGYYSGAIPHSANIGTNGVKGNIARGGFGKSGYSSARS